MNYTDKFCARAFLSCARVYFRNNNWLWSHFAHYSICLFYFYRLMSMVFWVSHFPSILHIWPLHHINITWASDSNRFNLILSFTVCPLSVWPWMFNWQLQYHQSYVYIGYREVNKKQFINKIINTSIHYNQLYKQQKYYIDIIYKVTLLRLMHSLFCFIANLIATLTISI